MKKAAYEGGQLPVGSTPTPEGVRIPQPFDTVLGAGERWRWSGAAT